MKGYIILALGFLAYANIALAQSSVPIPTGVGIGLDDLILLAQSLAGFLIILGGVLAGITIVVTGIMYMTAGSNQQKVAAAKGMFKTGIIGSLIIFGVGLIIATIRTFATNPFGFFQ